MPRRPLAGLVPVHRVVLAAAALTLLASLTVLLPSYAGSDSVTFAAVDTTPPVINFDLVPPIVPAGGWYTTDVTLTWSVVEEESPGSLVKDGCADQNVTQDRPYTMYICGALSDGGEASVVEVSFGRDATKPTISAAAAPAANGAGWHSASVTVHFTCTDATSGIPPGSCPPDQVLSTEGASVSSMAQTVLDTAGNVSALSNVVTVKVDKTPPSLAPKLSEEAPYKHDDVIATPNASDAGSGLASFSCGQVDTSTAGAHTVTCTATDKAGNASSKALQYEVLSIQGVILFGNRPPSSGGYGTFAFGGGTFPQLLVAAGCPAATSVFFYNKPDGAFAVWIPGSQVSVVNAEILAIFALSPPLPEGVIFTAKCA